MKKIALALAAVGALALVLTGCSSYTHADAAANRYSVVETKNAEWFDYPEFSYTDSEGQLQPLNTCESGGLFEQIQCSNTYGNIVFAYTSAKGGRIASGNITVDGVKYELDCSADADDTWSGIYICVNNQFNDVTR